MTERVIPTLNEQQVDAIISEGLSRKLLEHDVDGEFTADPDERLKIARTLAGMADQAFQAGSRGDDITAILFLAEVDMQPKAPEQTGGDVADGMTALEDSSLVKIERALRMSEDSPTELEAIHAEMLRRGMAPTWQAAETNGNAQAPAEPVSAGSAPEEVPAEPAEEDPAERAELESKLTFAIMRAHSLDPSEIPGTSIETLRWIIEHPTPAVGAPAPEAAVEIPQPQGETIETTRMVVQQPEPPAPPEPEAATPEVSPPTSGRLSAADREKLEEQVTGPMLKCVAAGEQVLMADGSRRAIENVRIGDAVLSSDGVQTQVDLVTDHWAAGRKNVLRVRLADGRTLRVTPEHRVFGWDTWTTAGQLEIGDPVCVPLSTTLVPGIQSVPLDDAFLLALWLAEGLKNLKRYQAFRYTSAMDEIHSRVEEIALSRGWSVTTYARDIDRAITRGDDRTRSRSAVAFLREHGLGDVRVDTIFAPQAIMMGSRDIVGEFLSTYIACDGCVHMGTYRGVRVTSASERLMRDLQILSARLGVRSTVTYVGVPPSRVGMKPTWMWAVSGIDAICELADTLHIPGKQMLLDDLAAGLRDRRQHGGVIPPAFCDDLVVKAPRGFTQRETSSSWLTGAKATQLLDWPKNAPVAEALRQKLDSGLGWARVVAVEELGEVETYDLETARHHAFFLEGALTHNSFGKGRNNVPDIGDLELGWMIAHPDAQGSFEEFKAAKAKDAEIAGGSAEALTQQEIAEAAVTGGEMDASVSAELDAAMVQTADAAFAPPAQAQITNSQTAVEPAPVAEEAPPAPVGPVQPQPVAQEAPAPAVDPTPAPALPTAAPDVAFESLMQRENLPLPPEVPDPPVMPFDMSKLTSDEIYSLHSRFHSCEQRVNLLITNDEDVLGDIEKLRRGREIQVAADIPMSEDGKKLSESQRAVKVASDPEVQRYSTQEHEMGKKLRKLKVMSTGYHRDVERCSRQLTRFSKEYAGD